MGGGGRKRRGEERRRDGEGEKEGEGKKEGEREGKERGDTSCYYHYYIDLELGIFFIICHSGLSYHYLLPQIMQLPVVGYTIFPTSCCSL